MDLLLISRYRGVTSIDLKALKTILIIASLFGIVASGLVSVGYIIGQQKQSEWPDWVTSLDQDRKNIQRISKQTINDLDALALNLGKMEARSLRLDALSSRLIEMAGLGEEFNFEGEPAIGGSVDSSQVAGRQPLPGLSARFTELHRQINNHQRKFQLLESIMIDRYLTHQALPAGKPVIRGWLTSKYGYRADPFSGKHSWHSGVDFAGKLGSDIIAVAAGIVTYSGFKGDLGKLVEVSHGNGYVTRYAHNMVNLVEVGDTVKKGEAIAKIGSSGRSTGPHVHFEILRDGKAVNPVKYIRRVAAR